ncbi:MAG: hypothetical protein J2P17_19305, partial [Mycobacterium sp.]|nr:hypothetical protein [Mycobacterium sp.]
MIHQGSGVEGNPGGHQFGRGLAQLRYCPTIRGIQVHRHEIALSQNPANPAGALPLRSVFDENPHPIAPGPLDHTDEI